MGMRQTQIRADDTPDIEEIYARAIQDAVSVICAQIAAAEKVGDDAALDINRSLNQLGAMKDQHNQIIDAARNDLSAEIERVLPASEQSDRIRELQAECKSIEDELFSDLSMAVLGLAANVQFQDIQRQILEEVAQIVRDLGEVDLATLTGSVDGAEVPRKILENARTRYVMQLQRTAHAEALGEYPDDPDDPHDIFF